jgi:hypothetical protein
MVSLSLSLSLSLPERKQGRKGEREVDKGGLPPAKRLRTPPARHSARHASSSGRDAALAAARGAPCLAVAAAAASACRVEEDEEAEAEEAAALVCAIRYTLSRSSGAVAVRETTPAMPPARK